ncbi:MAG: hypothetical protein ACOX69_09555 [Coriobacteriales bacterium]|jgi:Zn ribbon nucleic-acid-binding protein
MEKSALNNILPRLKTPAIVGACCAALVVAFAIAPPPADAATSSKPHRPAIAKASISGKAKSYTVKVKVKKAKVKKGWGAVVRVKSKGMRTRTAKVGKKRTVTVRKVRAKECAKVKVSVRSWHKARGKRKAWSRTSRTVSLTAPVTRPAKPSLTDVWAPDTSHFEVTVSKASHATSYEVRYADNASFSRARTIGVKGAGTFRHEGVPGTVNYVKVRSVRTVGKKRARSSWSGTVRANLSPHEHSYTVPVYETTHHAAKTSTFYECMACGYQTTDKDKMESHSENEVDNPDNPYTYDEHSGVYRTVKKTVPAYDVKTLVGYRCTVCGGVEAATDTHEHSYTEAVYGTLYYAEEDDVKLVCKCGYKTGSEQAMSDHINEHLDNNEPDLANYSYDFYTLPAYSKKAIVGYKCTTCGDVKLS